MVMSSQLVPYYNDSTSSVRIGQGGLVREIADRALNVAQLLVAAYADIRVVHERSQLILVKNGRVEALSHDENAGLGVRVIANGAWGFASSSTITLTQAEAVARRAVR